MRQHHVCPSCVDEAQQQQATPVPFTMIGRVCAACGWVTPPQDANHRYRIDQILAAHMAGEAARKVSLPQNRLRDVPFLANAYLEKTYHDDLHAFIDAYLQEEKGYNE